MMLFADAVCRLIERHPTLKMFALSFLLLISVMLLAEGSGQHIEKCYVYFAMAFSLGIELLNMRGCRRRPLAGGPPAYQPFLALVGDSSNDSGTIMAWE